MPAIAATAVQAWEYRFMEMLFSLGLRDSIAGWFLSSSVPFFAGLSIKN
jgi:hypothetical protein